MSTALVTFGEAVLTFKPRPPHANASAALPLAAPAREVVEAVGGAELNVAVAYSLLSGGKGNVTPSASWVSALPAGPLGDHVEGAATAAGVVTTGVMRDTTPNADLGTLHVVNDGSGPRPHYQRHHSSFTTAIGATTFDWPSLLSGSRWLHSTGITAALGPGPRDAFLAALKAAKAGGVSVGVDINWRPALGTLEELWATLHPCVTSGEITLLMLSQDTLEKLGEKEGVWTPPSEGGFDALHDAHLATLAALRSKWGVPLLACGFKRPRVAPADEGASTSKHKDTLKGGGGVRRWSVVACADGLASTRDTPTEHIPVEALGGGDAWMGGFVHTWLNSPLTLTPSSSAADIATACRTGDLSAALSMAKYGDMTDVSGASLKAMADKWAGTTAYLDGTAPAEAKSAISMPSWSGAIDKLAACKIVPVVGIDDPSDAAPVAKALLAGGLDCIELVLRTPAAEESLKIIAEEVPGMFVGAGTVLSIPQAERAVAKGAKFLVSPGSNPKVITWCVEHGVPIVPGIATASEVEAAMELGLKTLKFFPAEPNGGAPALKGLSGPYGPYGVRFMPTGGVTTANIHHYLSLPTVFAAGGTWLVPPKALKEKDYKQIEELARAAVQAVAAL